MSTTWNPADCQAHDEAEALAGEAALKAAARMHNAAEAVQHDAGNRRVYRPELRRSVWTETWTTAEALERLPEYAARTAEQYHAAVAEADRTQAAYLVLARQYAGWSRFYLVPDGHVHSSTQCSTCNRGQHATEFRWVTSLSGLTEADAVAEYGSLLCTVCFPSAPVEFTDGSTMGRVAAEAKAQREAERAARLQAKQAKALRDDLAEVRVVVSGDGTGRWDTERVGTLAALKMRMTDAAEAHRMSHLQAMAELFVTRTNELAARGHGKATTVEAEVAAAVKRAAKR